MTLLSLSPATDRGAAFRNLDPNQPLEGGDSRYQDLTEARGDDAAGRLKKRLLQKQGGVWLQACFVSHRGAGKSTELKRVSRDIAHRYHVLYFEANVEMNGSDIDIEDLLLVFARQVALEMEKAKLPLEPALLDRVASWFATTLDSTVAGMTYRAELESKAALGATVPLFAELTGRFSALLKAESEHRTEVKSVLRNYPGALLDNVNALLTAAHQRLKAERNQELLIVVDNLDRYDPKVVDALLVRRGDFFSQICCNLVLTPPILLHYQPESGSLQDFFQVDTMPAVRLRGKDDPYETLSGSGPDLLISALSRRVEFSTFFEDRSLALRLIFASGGNLRELLEVTANAMLEGDVGALTTAEVDKAVSRHRIHKFRQALVAGWLPHLVRVSVSKQIEPGIECMRALFQRLLFEYNSTGWYDVHPLLTEVPEFTKARHALLFPPPVP